MLTLALTLATIFAPTTSPVACQDSPVRLDGSIVTICGGTVTRVRMATPTEFARAAETARHALD